MSYKNHLLLIHWLNSILYPIQTNNYTEKLFISIFTIVFFNLGKNVSLWEFLSVKILNFIIMLWNFSTNYSKIWYELCWSFYIIIIKFSIFTDKKTQSDTFFPESKNTIAKNWYKKFLRVPRKQESVVSWNFRKSGILFTESGVSTRNDCFETLLNCGQDFSIV